jgi:hypothetical protein
MNPGHPHESGVNSLNSCFHESIANLTTEFSLNEDRPLLQVATNKMTVRKDMHSHHIPDLALAPQNGNQAPMIIVEVAFSESFSHVTNKVKDIWLLEPSVLGVLVLNVTESPRYRAPEPPTRLKEETQESWLGRSESEGDWGEIVVDGHRWSGKFSCQATLFRSSADDISAYIVPPENVGSETVSEFDHLHLLLLSPSRLPMIWMPLTRH